MNVLENILKQIDELKENYWCDSKERKDGAMDMSNIIKDIIKQHLQSGEDNNVLAGDWVPCSVRMPDKEYDTVLCVTDINHYFVGVYNKEYGFRTGDIDAEGNVIAWRPLPEPYKPDPESTDGKRQREREEFFSEYKEQSDQTITGKDEY